MSPWCERDVEPSVAVEEAGGGAVLRLVFPGGDEHGDFGAVLAVVEHLLHGVVGRLEALDLGLHEDLKTFNVRSAT